MGCVEDLGYEVIASGVSFKESRAYIEEHCPEVYYVNPGFRIFEKAIIGVPPIAIGIENSFVILPYTKPCYGTFILRVDSASEADMIRTSARKKP
ncbi:hypothetical protein ASZ90_014694 [hydrocarbon metagenome]|uniref:DUF1894 domain-containing protein n=1 Tax=hydrocarbon metagenome TaxID=938273 RepID=A0A0W8F4A3_9ZZZZ